MGNSPTNSEPDGQIIDRDENNIVKAFYLK